MITYLTIGPNVVVSLDGKRVGTIRPHNNGFAYFPYGQRTPGETLPTVEEIKRTLEEM